MVPYQITLIPVFQTVFDFHWLNTYQGLIVPRATSAFGIFLLRQFFVTMPRDLDAAARLDGASEFRIYWSIMLPLAGPALATLAVFHFMYNWNDFLWPLVITSSTEMRTLPGRADAVLRAVRRRARRADGGRHDQPRCRSPSPSFSPSATSCRASPRLESSR